jgi:hypothetical protein
MEHQIASKAEVDGLGNYFYNSLDHEQYSVWCAPDHSPMAHSNGARVAQWLADVAHGSVAH